MSNQVELTTPVAGVILRFPIQPGVEVAAGTELVVIESMKTEFVVTAPRPGTVGEWRVSSGATVAVGEPLGVFLGARSLDLGEAPGSQAAGGSAEEDRGDLTELRRRRAVTLDFARPAAVEKRRLRGQRTARENLADLCDDGSFVEYGGLAIAAQRTRRSVDELIERTPADGLVCGLATINAELVGRERAGAAVLAYDASVLAGTQGSVNHRKKDRIFELAARKRLPLVLFAEGGGGRPGDVDVQSVAALDVPAFHLLARLSGVVPLIGIASGRCFAGNAALLGCCDVIIATEGSNIGMGGPAMIEGGGLGVFAPEQIGALAEQTANGLVDLAVADEAEAVAAARRCLTYFQGPLPAVGPDPSAAERLRAAVPENRARAFSMRAVIEAIADPDSVFELQGGFAPGIVTALARVEGEPIAVIANDSHHLGGAIDCDGAEALADFLELCEAQRLPIVSLLDTPGFMVGPDSERAGAVRRMSRLFTVGAKLTVPLCAVVIRKAYGLGAMAMCGGSTRVPVATVGWPTSEFGGMGLEGAIKLGYKRELDAIADPDERRRAYETMVEIAYERGRGLNLASLFEIDDVIDPAETRSWISAAIGS